MKKAFKIAIFLIIVLILINVVAYCFLSPKPESKTENEKLETLLCMQKEDNECLYLLAIKYNNLSICDIYDYPSYKPNCLRYYAIANNNPSYCKDVTELSDHIDCYIYLALSNKDTSLCGKDNTNRHSKEECEEVIKTDYKTCNKTVEEPCFFTAIINKDISMCHKLEESSKIVCLTLLTRNSQLCKDLPVPEEICEAMATRNISKCGDIYDCEDEIKDYIFLTKIKNQ